MAKTKKEEDDFASEEEITTSDPTVRKRKKDKDEEKKSSKKPKKDKDKEKKDKDEASPDTNKMEEDADAKIPEDQMSSKTEPKKAPKLMTTREIGKQYMDREKFLKLSLREMIIYLIFLIIVGFLAAFQHNSSEYYLSRVMTKLFVEKKFKTWSTKEVLSYNEINTLEQVWEYFNLYLFNTYWRYWYSTRDEETDSERKSQPVEQNMEDLILFNNRLIGRPRLRQLRVSSDSCTVPEDFKLMFEKCYPEYSSSTESKKTFSGPNENNTKEPASAWSFSEASELGSLSVSGEISTYGGGGFYMDFDKNMTVTNDTIREKLFKYLWIDRASRAIILQFTTYNANENIFFTLTLLMELPPTGGVLPSYIIHTERFLVRDIQDYIIFALFVLFCIFVFVYTISEIFEIFYFRWHYLDYFWNFCDLVILVLCYVAIGFFVYAHIEVRGKIEKLVAITDKHACFDSVNSARENFITFMAVLFFFTSIKLLKYMNFNHSMFQMQMTLQKATKDIACFSIIFFIVFITFAQLGHLLFGSQVRDFRSFIHSVFALLRTAVGDFDYHKIENVNHFLGPIYFFAYIFFIYFILVNMFLAIIIDTYSEVRTSIRDQAKELQISDIVCGWLRKCCMAMGCAKLAAKHDQPLPKAGTTAFEDIQNLLRKCGFTEMEIDLFFAKFDIPKDRQVSQEEMRQKLLTNFDTQPDEKGKVPEGHERDEVGEKLMGRIRLLEDNITDVNYKIDLIDNKIDAIQQIRARRRYTAQMEKEREKERERQEKEKEKK